MFDNIYEAETAIHNLIKKDNNCSAHFKYDFGINSCKFDLVTYNPTHKTQFLLHSTNACKQLNAIEQMYEYLYDLKNSLQTRDSPCHSYTVEWYSHPQNKKYISSFYGRDIREVLKKFYYGKLEESLTIYGIKLNPIS